MHKKIKNTSIKIKHEKLKYNVKVLGSNNKIISMKWFIVKIILNVTIVQWEKILYFWR